MTLYISDIKKRSARKTLLIYNIITVFTIVFSAVYESLSHGVYSGYMVFLFLFPLIGGVLPFTILALIKKIPYPGAVSRNLYHSGLATLAIGSCVIGILEIYGTTSALVIAYPMAGVLLLFGGIIVYVFNI